MKKIRLDQLVFDLGLAESRERAKTSVMAGLVYVNGQKETKPGAAVDSEARIELRGDAVPYVSRGGLKLEKALRVFSVDPAGWVCVDCGASTGGFTDVLLKNGAEKVYAVDVGYGQLAWKLRSDPRVVCMERTNIRGVTPEQLGEPLDLSVVDVSFISLKLVLPVIHSLLKPDGQVLCLIKPQFEAGKEKVGKKGVVRDPEVHAEVLEHFVQTVGELGFCLKNLTFSPVKGPEGNIEFLGHLSKAESEPFRPDIPAIVAQAHLSLNAGKETL
jgi:23S rRNA (cytidine1920-2'-O)/16S rRNA (cytidine1409-2'-O)-methyltransferase